MSRFKSVSIGAIIGALVSFGAMASMGFRPAVVEATLPPIFAAGKTVVHAGKEYRIGTVHGDWISLSQSLADRQPFTDDPWMHVPTQQLWSSK